MKKKKYLYPSGEFAKLTGVNKRTLHYYNDIGLFCPAVVEENGYHYYTCFQFAQLELILTLRKIGLPIDEIREYITGSSRESCSQMMEKRKKLIDDSIKQLLSAQAFLEQKAERIQIGMNAQHGMIELCTLPERKIILSPPITGKYDEEDFTVAAEFSLQLKKRFRLYDNFGSRISVHNLQEKHFNRYSSFYAYYPHPQHTHNTIYSELYSEPYNKSGDILHEELLPEGTYLRAFSIGEWNRLPDVYQSILTYAEKHNLTLTGYAYEEGLNEMAVKTQKDYVTMITIPYKATP